MSEKIYGQIAWESTHDPRDSDWHELDNADKVMLETQAQSVIAEFLNRQKPIAWIVVNDEYKTKYVTLFYPHSAEDACDGYEITPLYAKP